MFMSDVNPGNHSHTSFLIPILWFGFLSSLLETLLLRSKKKKKKENKKRDNDKNIQVFWESVSDSNTAEVGSFNSITPVQ